MTAESINPLRNLILAKTNNVGSPSSAYKPMKAKAPALHQMNLDELVKLGSQVSRPLKVSKNSNRLSKQMAYYHSPRDETIFRFNKSAKLSTKEPPFIDGQSGC